jgi:hypothetical protein
MNHVFVTTTEADFERALQVPNVVFAVGVDAFEVLEFWFGVSLALSGPMFGLGVLVYSYTRISRGTRDSRRSNDHWIGLVRIIQDNHHVDAKVGYEVDRQGIFAPFAAVAFGGFVFEAQRLAR